MVDLHTHSSASDGSLSPTELVQLAEASGITYLALTDHNTTAGLSEFQKAAQGTGVHAIPGVEISCELGNQELHVLALDLPKEYWAQVETVLVDVLKRAEESKRELVANLRRDGFRISYEGIQAEHPKSVINRAHIGLALKRAGYVASVQEAFQTLLNEDAGYYHPAKRLSASEVLRMIRDVHAIPVWSHPFLKLDYTQVKQALNELVPMGLVGMETFYSTYSEAQTQSALELANAFHLKPSGGSDFHGEAKPNIHLGTGFGNLNIPDCTAVELLAHK